MLVFEVLSVLAVLLEVERQAARPMTSVSAAKRVRNGFFRIVCFSSYPIAIHSKVEPIQQLRTALSRWRDQ